MSMSRIRPGFFQVPCGALCELAGRGYAFALKPRSRASCSLANGCSFEYNASVPCMRLHTERLLPRDFRVTLSKTACNVTTGAAQNEKARRTQI